MKRVFLATVMGIALASYAALPGQSVAQDDVGDGSDVAAPAPDPLPGYSTESLGAGATNINRWCSRGKIILNLQSASSRRPQIRRERPRRQTTIAVDSGARRQVFSPAAPSDAIQVIDH
jgi:hypothetical protein